MTAPPRIVDPDDPLWPLWRALAAEFRAGRVLRHVFTSRAGWGFYGLDIVSTFRASPMARRSLAMMVEVPDDLLRRLLAVASLNARRNEAMWRMAAMFYVTVPVTLVLAGLQGAPEFVRSIISDTGPGLGLAVAAMTIWLLYYFFSLWRARQVEAVVELARIERGLDGSAGSA